jgi:hypothetical protein
VGAAVMGVRWLSRDWSRITRLDVFFSRLSLAVHSIASHRIDIFDSVFASRHHFPTTPLYRHEKL